MAMFNSYVKLPEGIPSSGYTGSGLHAINGDQLVACDDASPGRRTILENWAGR